MIKKDNKDFSQESGGPRREGIHAAIWKTVSCSIMEKIKQCGNDFGQSADDPELKSEAS